MVGSEVPHILAVDIGGTSTRVAVARTPRGRMHRRVFPTPVDHPPDELVEAIAQAARELRDELGVSLAAAGVASAGTIDDRRGVIVESPNLPRFNDVPLRDILSDRLGVPAVLENDANAAALAENRHGVGRGSKEMVYITVSTGIGGGIITGGKLYRGAVGGAGEFGHMTIQADGPSCSCGGRGCWEMLGSGTAIAREAQRRVRTGEASSVDDLVGGEIERITAREVFQAARGGDGLSQRVIDEAARYLGIGLANVVNILNPEVIVLGGGIARTEGGFVETGVRIAQERAFKLHSGSVEVRVTEMGDDNGLRGALLLAQELVRVNRRAARSRTTRG